MPICREPAWGFCKTHPPVAYVEGFLAGGWIGGAHHDAATINRPPESVRWAWDRLPVLRQVSPLACAIRRRVFWVVSSFFVVVIGFGHGFLLWDFGSKFNLQTLPKVPDDKSRAAR